MTQRSELVLCLAMVLSVAGGARIVRHPFPMPPVARGVAQRPLPKSLDQRDVRQAGRLVVEADPFRLDRQPASVAFALHPAIAAGVAKSVFRGRLPTLTVRGIAGGPPWEALVDGIPGREGVLVVRAGDRLGDLHIVSITRDTVIVQGMDTTWRLTMVRAWR